MTSVPKLVDLDLVAFSAALADGDASPLGAALCCYAGACGAALASMVFARARDERPDAPSVYSGGRALELEELRTRALAALEPRGERRSGPPPTAFDTPEFETLELCLSILRLVASGAPDAAPERRADLATGALCAWSGAEGAYGFVHAGAGRVTGADARASELVLATATALREEAASLLAEVQRVVELPLLLPCSSSSVRVPAEPEP